MNKPANASMAPKINRRAVPKVSNVWYKLDTSRILWLI